jgi:MFS family permease
MERGGITKPSQVAMAGAVFEVSIVLGGIILGGYVDRTKAYKNVTLGCLAISLLLLLPLGLTEHKLGKEPVLMVLSLLGLGFFTGPIQPINAELAVDLTFPGDETAVESVQQIGGNLVSALLMPCAQWAARQYFQLFSKIPLLASDIRGDVILLMMVTALTYFYFSSFDSPLKRTIADRSSANNVQI